MRPDRRGSAAHDHGRDVRRAGRSQTTLPAACSPAIRIRTPRDAPTSGTSTRSQSQSEGTDTILPAGSLLARWQSAESQAEKQQLAEQLERLLTGPAPSAGADTPDAALYRQLTSLAGPLFAGVTRSGRRSPAANTWGLDPKLFGKHPDGTADRRGKSLCPSALGDRGPSACRPGRKQRVRGHRNARRQRAQAKAACSWKC